MIECAPILKDNNVKLRSDQIVRALKANNISVDYILFPNEGHGFARPENRMAFEAISEQFLYKCLGGRRQRIGDEMKNSSAMILSNDYLDLGIKEETLF